MRFDHFLFFSSQMGIQRHAIWTAAG